MDQRNHVKRFNAFPLNRGNCKIFYFDGLQLCRVWTPNIQIKKKKKSFDGPSCSITID